MAMEKECVEAIEEAVDDARRYGGATREEILAIVTATLDSIDADVDARARSVVFDRTLAPYPDRLPPPPSNPSERRFAEEMHGRGWIVSKRGWPDFFCVGRRTGQVVLVEVKPAAHYKLKREQLAVLKTLAAYGVPCSRWSPDGGFVRIEA
jgi:hypothetical protein